MYTMFWEEMLVLFLFNSSVNVARIIETNFLHGCQGTGAFLAMRKPISLLDKRQLHRYSVQSRLLEYLSVR